MSEEKRPEMARERVRQFGDDDQIPDRSTIVGAEQAAWEAYNASHQALAEARAHYMREQDEALKRADDRSLQANENTRRVSNELDEARQVLRTIIAAPTLRAGLNTLGLLEQVERVIGR